MIVGLLRGNSTKTMFIRLLVFSVANPCLSQIPVAKATGPQIKSKPKKPLAASNDDCRKNNNPAQDRLMYIADYEMYSKAGNSQKMSSIKKTFPFEG